MYYIIRMQSIASDEIPIRILYFKPRLSLLKSKLTETSKNFIFSKQNVSFLINLQVKNTIFENHPSLLKAAV